MLSLSTLRSATAFVLFLVAASVTLPCNAAIISVSTDDNGQGMQIALVLPEFEITVFKDYFLTGEMFLDVLVDSDGLYSIDEMITNFTGDDWSGFQWSLTGETQGVFEIIDAIDSTGTFPDTTLTSTSGRVDGGVLPVADFISTSLTIELSGSMGGGGFFRLSQSPIVSSNVIPEPSSLAAWAGLGLIGGFVCWRRRRKK